VHGIKADGGARLDRIEKRSLGNVFQAGDHWQAAQGNILAGLNQLFSLSKTGGLAEGRVYSVFFRGRKLHVSPFKGGHQVLPPVGVVKELIGF
jgi:hypothetical protein